MIAAPEKVHQMGSAIGVIFLTLLVVICINGGAVVGAVVERDNSGVFSGLEVS